ncbi:hypothetical protein HG531_013460 [Fusarium graminearum]|nr:hypothetical protein HG531_013460 [Fusarium graminearum]
MKVCMVISIVFIKVNNLGLAKLAQSCFNQIRHVIAEAFMCCAGQAVVARVGEQPSVEIGKGGPVDRIITRLDHLGADFRYENIMQHENTTAATILGRAKGFAKHVKHFAKRVINISVLTAIKVLRAHDYHEVGGAVQLPADISRRNKDLNCTVVIKMLDNTLVTLTKGLVVVANTVRECLGKRLLVNAIKQRLHLFHLGMKETILVVVGKRCG